MATKKAILKKEKPGEIKPTAKAFVESLAKFKTRPDAINNSRYFRNDTDKKNECLGVRFGTIFKLAKEFEEMEPKEIEKLLENKHYEVRMGAVSIMDFQARNKKTTEGRRKELFDLYIHRHDRINNWDLVDRSAIFVVGRYLVDKPRAILYKLAKSKNPWERRTAVVSTYAFVRQGQLDDTFAIAELLIDDAHDLIHKAVGSWIREAGKRDQQRLLKFLDKFARKMPRSMLRYAVEKLDKKTKDSYLNKEV